METLFLVILCLFATYGFATLSREIVYSIWDRGAEKNSCFKVVLVVKDCEQEVEWVVQRMLNYRLPNGSESMCRLTVVDLGSIDETEKILERLKCKYPELEILQENEKEKIFQICDVENNA